MKHPFSLHLSHTGHVGYLMITNKSVFSLLNSAVNMALPAFAAEHRAAARWAPGVCRCQSISPASTGAQQQTRRTPLLRSNDGTNRRTDGETDGRTPDRYIDPAPHTVRAVPITNWQKGICHLQ